MILGDNALFSFADPAGALAGQSAADRLLRVESVKTERPEGADRLWGNDGRDIIIAGFGADQIHGGTGQDILIGDTAIITRRWENDPRGGLTEWLTIDTNYAFLTGGKDTIWGDEGPDVMIGNLGPDLFYGDTAKDAIFSDGYAGLFRAYLPKGFAAAPEDDKRYLYTSNFAGQGAVDVVSNAQQNAAIGDPLDGRNDLDSVKHPSLTLRANTVNVIDFDLWRTVVDQLDEPQVIAGLAELIAMGAGSDLMAQSMLATLIESGLLSGDVDPIVLEMLLDRLAQVLQQHVQNGFGQEENLPLAAE